MKQAEAMLIIGQHDGVTNREIAEALGESVSDARKVTLELWRRGLVSRTETEPKTFVYRLAEVGER